MQISQSNYTIMKIIMIPISDFQEVIFLDLETLPKLVFTILVPLQILQTNCEFQQTLVFCPEPWKVKIIRLTPPNSITF